MSGGRARGRIWPAKPTALTQYSRPILPVHNPLVPEAPVTNLTGLVGAGSWPLHGKKEGGKTDAELAKRVFEAIAGLGGEGRRGGGIRVLDIVNEAVQGGAQQQDLAPVAAARLAVGHMDVDRQALVGAAACRPNRPEASRAISSQGTKSRRRKWEKSLHVSPVSSSAAP